MMTGIIYIEKFIDQPATLYDQLMATAQWDDRMVSRKTASYGVPYNYGNIDYSFQEFLPPITELLNKLPPVIGFMPNNCLVNYYMDGQSKMGYHSDQTDILEPCTGVAIVSVGETRVLRFRNIIRPEEFMAYELPSGSLIYMSNEVQDHWQHAIPISKTAKGRISLTFRKIVSQPVAR